MLFGGHLADRYDRRTIVLADEHRPSRSARGALASCRRPGWSPCSRSSVVIFVAGTASGFERPALSAFEAQIIPREDAARGVSYVSSVEPVGSIVGPAMGGIAAAVVGVAWTYGSSRPSWPSRRPASSSSGASPCRKRVEGERVIDSLLAGIKYVRRSPALLGSMALDLFAVFFGGAIALLPIFATDILHVGAAGLGFLRAAPSVGALLVMLVATRWPPSRHAGRTLLITVAGFGVSMLVFGMSTSFVLSLVALFFSGVTDGISMIIRNTILRVLSPERLRGRVASVNWVFIGASNELGAFESGVAARLFGAVPSVVAGGVVTLIVVGLVSVAVPSLRELDIGTARPHDET